MAEFTLTVYGDDDVTPLFEVGTATNHANPYLHVPEQYRESSVDLLNGGAVIGQYNLRIIDPQNGATKAIRWLTAQLGSATGHSALMRRRALFQRVSPDTQVVIDGVVGRTALSESFAGFHVDVKDVRDRGRKVRAFVRDGTTSLMPRGIVEGYGEFAPGAGYYLVPPVRPLTGPVDVHTVGGVTYGFIQPVDDSGSTPDAVVPASLVVTDATAKVLASKELWELWWRPDPDDGAGWRKMEPSEVQSVDALTRKTRNADRNLVNVQAIQNVRFDPSAANAPANGANVSFLLVHVGEPSEDHPLHWEGPWGTFVTALLDGHYSSRDPRIRYDATAVAAIETPIRVRITEPREDLRDVLEDLHKAVGAAPALDDQGRLSPIRYELPLSAAGLTILDDSNCQPLPGWEHSADNAITVVEVKYHRDIRVPVEADLDGTVAAGDLLTEKEITERRESESAVLDVMGEQTLEIDGWMFRALGGDQGQPKFGDLVDEQGKLAADAAARRAIDRFVFGGQESWLQTSESVVVGQWVLDQRPWRPNYLDGQRGGSTLAQVVSVRQLNEAWSAVKLVDAAPEDQPLAAPTLGILTESEGIVTIPVSTVPTGAEVAVEYAINATEPAASSGKWTFADRVGAAGDVETPILPGNVTVWTRARSEAPGRMPSGWVSGGSIATTAAYRLRSASAVVQDDGSVDFEWDPLPSVAGVRIEYVVHETGTAAPAYTNAVDVDATLEAYSLAAGTVGPGFTITADLTPYSGFGAGAVSGTAGDPIEVSAGRGPSIVVPHVAIVSSPVTVVSGNARGNVTVKVLDAEGAAGTLRIWSNPGVTTSPDPTTEAPDASIAVSPGQTVGPTGSTANITTAALTDILVASLPYGFKRIFAEFETSDGRTSGPVLIPLIRTPDAGLPEMPGNIDDVPDGATYKRTTANEKTGGGRGYNALNASNRVVTGVEATATVTRSGGGTVSAGDVGDRAGVAGQIYFTDVPGFELEIYSKDTDTAAVGGVIVGWRRRNTVNDTFKIKVGGREIGPIAANSQSASEATLYYVYYDAGTGAVAATTSKDAGQAHDRIIIGEMRTNLDKTDGSTDNGSTTGGKEII